MVQRLWVSALAAVLVAGCAQVNVVRFAAGPPRHGVVAYNPNTTGPDDASKAIQGLCGGAFDIDEQGQRSQFAGVMSNTYDNGLGGVSTVATPTYRPEWYIAFRCRD